MSRSKHSLSHYHLTTLDMGQIVPIGSVPCLPADTLGHSTNLLIRVTPLAAPVMHQVDARVHHFYTPYRILDDDGVTWSWEDLITGGEDGMNTDKVPTLTTTGTPGDLLDYFGIPPVAGVSINALPIMAFNAIWNEWYRDQDLQVKRSLLDLTIPTCAWGKDYFTTARPWAQKGPAVSIPIGDKADVRINRVDNENIGIKQATGSNNYQMDTDGTANGPVKLDAQTTTGEGMYADLATATGADPLDVRKAWGLQRFMENAARFGSRYPEKMRQLGSTYRGVLDRPLYLGGGQSPINFSEVLQTANDATDRAFGVGDMYGHGIAAMRSNKYAYTCGEHGIIISMLSCRPKSVYQNGVHREFLKQDREDFFDPYLEFIGQQEVYLNELYLEASNQTGGEETIFGYSDKYQEYRGHPSYVSGEYRDTLDYWHMARQFTQKPVLNSDFVSCVPTNRIYNEQTQDQLWVMAHHKIAAHRNISRSATPRLT